MLCTRSNGGGAGWHDRIPQHDFDRNPVRMVKREPKFPLAPGLPSGSGMRGLFAPHRTGSAHHRIHSAEKVSSSQGVAVMQRLPNLMLS